MPLGLDDFARARIVPVIRTQTTEAAELAVECLSDAGFTLLELTLTVPGALDLLDRFAPRAGLHLGIGTVISADQARRAAEAGARFLVSPALRPRVADVARDLGVPAFLGAATPSEVLQAHECGAAGVKVFPAAQLGGPAFLKALKSVFPDIPLMPTGGISPENARSYLDAGAVCVGMGGKLVDGAALAAGDRAAIAEAAAQARAAVA